MTDRELLELAAKAAGFEFNPMWCDVQTGLLVWEPPTNYESRDWNPLTDDGDALRLGVKLGISLEADAAIEIGYEPGIGGEYASGVETWYVSPEAKTIKAQEVYLKDPYAATRRAIVRAAAEIGKGK